ncbi:MOLPALP family lipoprotein [Mesoplasma photuris]|uniref:MOLPALP family lipoprotein n=1 Tax=Mesoplasma photuris TaxID=217731 RepID=UPI0004E16D57|nr:MOLPALP family lipoprotein [Mesoplasma photuris]
MKRLIAIMGAITLTASSAATVVACGQNTNNNIDGQQFNNSESNINGSSAMLAKELILADQYNLSKDAINSQLNGLGAKKQYAAFDETLDADDRELGEDATIGDVQNRYFGNDPFSALPQTDLNLSGTKGDDHTLIGSILPQDGLLGMNKQQLEEAIDAIMMILPIVDGEILGSLPTILQTFLGSSTKLSLSGLISDLIPGGLGGIVVGAINLMITNPNLEKQAIDFIQTFSIKDLVTDKTTYANLMPMFLDHLISGIGSFMGVAPSEPIDFHSNLLSGPINEKSLIKLGKKIVNVFTAEKGEVSLNGILDGIKSLVKSLALLQLFLSTMDDYKINEASNGKLLFDNGSEANNSRLFKNEEGKTNSDTIWEITNKKILSDGFDISKFDGVDFAYLLSELTYFLGSSSTDESEKGLPLQQLLALMTAGPTVKKDIKITAAFIITLVNEPQVETKKTQLSPILIGVIEELLPVLSESGVIPSEIPVGIIQSLIIGPNEGALSLLIDLLLGNLSKILVDDSSLQGYSPTLGHLTNIIKQISENLSGPIVSMLPIPGIDNIKKILNDIVNILTPLNENIVANLDTWIPDSKNLFTMLYSKDFKEIKMNPAGIPLGIKIYDLLKGVLPKNIVDFFEDKPLNLKSIFNISINDLIKLIMPGFDSEFLNFFLDKSITQNFQLLKDQLKINPALKLSESNLMLSNTLVSGILTDLLHSELNSATDMYENELYRIFNSEDILDYIGIAKTDPVWTIRPDSFMDKFINFVYAPGEKDIIGDITRIISGIYNSVNDSKDYSDFINEKNNANDFVFSHKQPVLDNEGAIVKSLMEVRYYNPIEQKTYIYNFTSERNSKIDTFKFTAINKTIQTAE